MNKQSTANVWSAAQICQHFWVESNLTRLQIRQRTLQFYRSSSRRVCTTAICQQQQQQYTCPIPKRRHGLPTATTRQWSQQEHYRRSLTTRSYSSIHPQTTIDTSHNRKISTTDTNLMTGQQQMTPSSSRTILSAALEQSDASTAQSLLNITLQLLRRRDPQLAWECYTDLASRDLLRYVTLDQFKQLIKQFNHHSKHVQGLEYVLTLVEDMKHLGFQVARKEKLIVMRLLGMNGKLREMEKVFEDLGADDLDNKEQILLALDASNSTSNKNNNTNISNDIQKPYNIMLSSYQEHVSTIGTMLVAQKSMDIYGDMLDLGIRPSGAATRVLMENIRLGGHTDNIAELVWDWFWNKIGLNVGGKTRDLEPSLYREMVIYFTSAGRPEYALEINDIMTKKNMAKDRRMMTALIHKVGRAGDINKSMALLNDMMKVDQMEPDNITFNALIDIYTHKKPKPDFAGVSRMYSMMLDIGLEPDIYTYGTLINMFGKEGDLTMVHRLYKDLKSRNIAPSPHIYSALIECFINNDDQHSALDVLRILHQNTSQFDNQVQPNKVMYNILIKSYVDKHELRHAFTLIDLLKKADLMMDARTFTPVLSYYADRGNIKEIRKVMDKMEAYQVEGNAFTYTSLLHAYSKAGDMETAEQLFKEYKRRWRPNGHTFNALLYVYIKKNEIDKVFGTYKQMLKTFIKMTEHTYGLLMYFYSQRREPKAVEALMKTMQANEITPGAICWSILMQSYFRTGRSTEARQVMEQMVSAGTEPTWITWTTLINGLVQEGELDLAESVMQKTLERQKKKQEAQLDDIQQYFGGYAKLANIDLNSKSRSLLSDDQAYTQQLPTTIEDLLEQRQQQYSGRKPFIPPGHLFTPLIRGYTRNGQFDKARAIFNMMHQAGTPVNQTIYSTLMKLYQHEQRYDIVENMWQALRNRSQSASSPTHIFLDGIGDIALPIWQLDDTDDEETQLLLDINNSNISDSDTLTSDDMDDDDIKQTLPSPFILSTYMDSLMAQGRFDDICTLWNTLEQEAYPFDEQNWNRYSVSLVSKGDLMEACHVVHKRVLEASDEDVKKNVRPRDQSYFFSDTTGNHLHLHRRTCLVFADAFDIPGHTGMGSKRLRSLVVEKINFLVKEQQKTTNLE
ncbi:uncharacterized protein BX664DRAFT_277156 [Halteromyces radiatus]|uniref:uncharacterized protein n=1 Tax=Halteromyces radiatus TaxID=101107 RepID=UPI0022203171|nr:uncharacterized protein BX664DRAFT_277156 [Halteromyces radiatus]KAI8092711.1 hypothetical protein BX664DRAFT_277156 [Halteromyces radiatus]